MINCHNFASFGKRICMRNCRHQFGLWACFWGGRLSRCRKTLPIVDGTVIISLSPSSLLFLLHNPLNKLYTPGLSAWSIYLSLTCCGPPTCKGSC